MTSSAKFAVSLFLVVGCGDDGNVPADAPATTVNGCTQESATDLTANGADRTIAFAGITYTPKCAKIKVGQSVTFSGTEGFGLHPLRAGTVVGSTRTPQPGSPIESRDSGTEATFAFPTAGTFPYYCNVHFQFGDMFGAIYVEP